MSTQTLQQRYGMPSPRRRGVTIIAVVVVAAAAVGWLAWAALAQAARGRVSGDAVAIRVVDARHLEVDVVVRRPAGTAVVCTARALDDNRETVGVRTVSVPPEGDGPQRLTIPVGTTTPASAGELVRCAAAPSG